MNHSEVGPKSTQIPPQLSIPLSDLKMTLKTNCLLTRRPLCFLTPPRSLFFYKNPWLFISSILFEHGYKTEIFQLPFQDIELKKKVLNLNLDRLKNKHLFVDPVTYSHLHKELNSLSNCTLTIITSKKIELKENYSFETHVNSRGSLSYLLHQIWCRILGLETPDYSDLLINCPEATWHAFLDHCVRLAEIDFELEY